MKSKGSILIVDDKEELLLTFKHFLSGHFESIHILKDPNQLPALLIDHSFDVILLDMNFNAGISSGNEGLYWMKRILESDPDATVVFITAFGDVELAVKAMKEGATDFIQKSWDEKKILSTIIAAYKLHQSRLEIKKLRQQKDHLSHELQKEYKVCRARSHSMKQVYAIVDKIKDTDASVLILGENGTGKEILAREIHQASSRRKELFVPVDLGSLTESLLESELFGHVKGAFTDATADRKGRFEVASGGTLFLDEIGNLPVHLQTKLLSAIQNRQIIRVGSNRPVQVDIRLICATNTPIFQKIDAGEFREDLLYRINTIQIELPPLRDRKVDIPLLAEHFLDLYASKYGKPGIRMNQSALDHLMKHPWPGNIRELQHVMEKTVILAGSGTLGPSDMTISDRRSSLQLPIENYNLRDHEKRIIELVLSKYGWNIRQSAQKLGIDRTTLYSKIRKYGIQQT
jgi:DNA-binding NtrC family response regulator